MIAQTIERGQDRSAARRRLAGSLLAAGLAALLAAIPAAAASPAPGPGIAAGDEVMRVLLDAASAVDAADAVTFTLDLREDAPEEPGGVRAIRAEGRADLVAGTLAARIPSGGSVRDGLAAGMEIHLPADPAASPVPGATTDLLPFLDPAALLRRIAVYVAEDRLPAERLADRPCAPGSCRVVRIALGAWQPAAGERPPVVIQLALDAASGLPVELQATAFGGSPAAGGGGSLVLVARFAEWELAAPTP